MQSTPLAQPAAGRSAARKESRPRLAPRTRKIALIVHIVASVALLGAGASTLVTALTVATTDDVQLAHSAYELMEGGTTALGIPFSLIALFSGVLLSVRGKWGLFTYQWVTFKLVALVAVILIGALGVGSCLAALAESADPTQESARWLLPALSATQIALLLASTSLSVTKPSRRLRRRSN